MLTPSEIQVLDAFSSDLAQRTGGDGNVRRSNDGTVRLTILRHVQDSGGPYEVRELTASGFNNALVQITRAVESAAP